MEPGPGFEPGLITGFYLSTAAGPLGPLGHPGTNIQL